MTGPDSLANRLDDVTQRWPLFVIGLTFVVLVGCVALVELLLDGVEYRRVRWTRLAT